MLFGFSTALGPSQQRYVLAAPARSDDLVLDRRRRDLGMLVLFATAAGALAALWLSGHRRETASQGSRARAESKLLVPSACSRGARWRGRWRTRSRIR